MSDAEEPTRDQLPLPDYDHLPIGSLESRIRTLDADGVSQLLAYERGHGNRLPAVQVLERRLEALDSGAQPTEGSPTAVAPETGAAPAGGSKASPQTSGPPVNAPSHGTPMNPAQPRD